MLIEVLPDDAQVPEAVSVPRIVRTWRDGRAYATFFKFADRGVWALDDREMNLIEPSLQRMDPATVFAVRAHRFRFVKRGE
jgi:hypothetical protein